MSCKSTRKPMFKYLIEGEDPPESVNESNVGWIRLFKGCFGLDTSEAKVYSLQRGLWTMPTSSTFLRYDFSHKNEKVYTDLTICYRIRYVLFH
ncbi:hypothetical protein SK128_015395 [Halocaridina rubra]|uniref:Uncharacterized protein n=1 Tax=Halocaridina rubra TaxID=373956 RepID=A0AAN8XFF8_HALRR